MCGSDGGEGGRICPGVRAPIFYPMTYIEKLIKERLFNNRKPRTHYRNLVVSNVFFIVIIFTVAEQKQNYISHLWYVGSSADFGVQERNRDSVSYGLIHS